MHRPRPFVLGVDLDGVCADFTASFRAVVAEERGVDADSLAGDVSWDFAEWDIEGSEFERLHRLAVLDHRVFRTMPVMPGAADVLWRLSDAGVWIRIITHRLALNWGHATIVADTVTWLDDARIPYRDLCFLGAKPEVEADCYVDDAAHNITALRESGNHVIVFDQSHNRGLDGPRAAGWSEIEVLVTERITELGLGLQAPLPGFDPGADRLARRIRSE